MVEGPQAAMAWSITANGPKSLCKVVKLCMKWNKIYTSTTVFTSPCESPQNLRVISGTYQDLSFLSIPVCTLIPQGDVK